MPYAKDSRPRNPRNVPAPSSDPPEVVDPVWLLQAVGVCIAAALVCSWLTVCLLFYIGEWQLILHPGRVVDRTPAAVGIPFDTIHFDAAETGQPRLTGWWIPADPAPAARPAQSGVTILYLHDGSGSLSAAVPTLALLHRAGLQVFAIDYRGFGQSDASSHPTEATMSEDSVAALSYLSSVRHVPVGTIVPYGVGLGASLAVALVHDRPQIPAVIVDNPDPNPSETAIAARPSRIIPVRLLFRERFDIAGPLATLGTPKLLIAGGQNSANTQAQIEALHRLFSRAASPTFSVTFAPARFEAGYAAVLSRFLDEYGHLKAN